MCVRILMCVCELSRCIRLHLPTSLYPILTLIYFLLNSEKRFLNSLYAVAMTTGNTFCLLFQQTSILKLVHPLIQ